MTATFRVTCAIAFAVATSIVLPPPSAHGQSEPGANQAAKPAGAARSPRGSTSATRPSSPLLERSLGWSGGVLAVGAVILIASRKFARPMGLKSESPGEQAQICSRVQLAPRQALHVVKIGSRTLVIGTGPQGSPVTLAQWTTKAEEAGGLPEILSSESLTDDPAWRIPGVSLPGDRAESPEPKHEAAA